MSHLVPLTSQGQTLVLAGLCQFKKIIGGRENIKVGTWNVRTLRPARNLMSIYFRKGPVTVDW